MITFDMLYAAVFSLMGLGALIVALTQVLKKLVVNANWYKEAIAQDKKWPGHLLAFISSLICSSGVLGVGLIWKIGIFTAFCVSCFSSWVSFVSIVLLMTGLANGEWSYEFVKKVLEWIKLFPVEPKEQFGNAEKEVREALDAEVEEIANKVEEERLNEVKDNVDFTC